MKENNIRILMINPSEHPRVVSTQNRIPAFKRLLCADNYHNGSIDIIIIGKNLGILRNRDGAPFDMQGNRKIDGEIIAGPFCIIEFDEHGFITSLSQENIQKYSKKDKGTVLPSTLPPCLGVNSYSVLSKLFFINNLNYVFLHIL